MGGGERAHVEAGERRPARARAADRRRRSAQTNHHLLRPLLDRAAEPLNAAPRTTIASFDDIIGASGHGLQSRHRVRRRGLSRFNRLSALKWAIASSSRRRSSSSSRRSRSGCRISSSTCTTGGISTDSLPSFPLRAMSLPRRMSPLIASGVRPRRRAADGMETASTVRGRAPPALRRAARCLRPSCGGLLRLAGR